MPKNIYSLGIIPARYGSTRFPGKPLVDINGKTMIQRVYEQACKSRLDEVVIATDDQRIFEHVKALNGRVEMTSSFHKTGTDRCAEVAALSMYNEVRQVINIQGDEPFIQPEQINRLLDFFQFNEDLSIATLAKKIEDQHQLFNQNTVKVVFDQHARALYFSRSTIPFVQKSAAADWLQQTDHYKHIGMYGFRKQVLLELAELPPGRLEKAESLEQLRWLENGYGIGVQITDQETFGIDSPEDLEKIRG